MLEFINRGIPFEYEITGEGMPFVFLHGMGGSVKQIDSTYDPLAGVQLIAMNQQGHGKSGVNWEKLDFNRMGDDVIALLDYLGVEKACFAGISMGAAVSLNIAVRYPARVEKLLLIRNAWTEQPMSQEVQTAYYDLGLALQAGSVEAFYQTKGWQIVKEPSAYTRNAFLSPFQDESSTKNWQKYLILPGKTPIPCVEVLEKLTIPVTILANRNDLCHPFAYGVHLQEHIPGSKLVEIPDKDRDGGTHRQMINQAIKEMLG